MVVERVHETKLAPEIIFDAIRKQFFQYHVMLQNSNMLHLQFIEEKDTHILKITVHVWENTNRVIILSTSQSKGFFNVSPLHSAELDQANFVIKVLIDLENEISNLKLLHQQKKVSDDQQNLLNSVNILMPTHMEGDTQSSIIVEIHNTSQTKITNFHITFPDIEDFFSVSGELKLAKILPGMEIEHSFNVKPKFQKGTFPFNVMIHGNDVSVVLNYFIKIGGTEIY